MASSFARILQILMLSSLHENLDHHELRPSTPYLTYEVFHCKCVQALRVEPKCKILFSLGLNLITYCWFMYLVHVHVPREYYLCHIAPRNKGLR